MFTGVVYTILVIFIHAWASVLLVLTGWAMRRPPNMGRVTGKIPTLLLLCNHFLLFICFGNSNVNIKRMRKLITSLALLFSICYIVNAQVYDLNIDGVVIKNFDVFKKGQNIHLISMTHDQYYSDNGKVTDTYKLETNQGKVFVTEKLGSVFDLNYSDAQSFWDSQIVFNVLEQLSKKGAQSEIRGEMEDEALEYINRVYSSGLAFNDPFLETYLYGIISKLAPSVLIDGRPGNINLVIERNPTANASMYPNGTLVINTGLLSILHSEDELAAILAHEIAHFVLDHSVQNFNKSISRQKRAEFWASFATALTAAAETAIAEKDPYYVPGVATIAVATISTSIAAELCERLGMKYSRAQETEADEAAVQLLKVLKYDTNALSTALSRIEETMRQERSIQMYFASDHPALIDRIKKYGTPSENVNRDFEKIISFAVSDAAIMKMQNKRFRQVLPLVSQNINNMVATADDYILKAYCLLYLKNDIGSSDEIMNILTEAKELDPNNINIYKAEILAYLRKNNYSNALSLLKDYKNKLGAIINAENNLPDDSWSNLYDYAMKENNWAGEMLIKLRSFK